MKKIFLLAFFSLYITAASQNGSYTREWATFIGPSGNFMTEWYLNSDETIDVYTGVGTLGTYAQNTAYYNQFVSPGNAGINTSVSTNIFREKLSGTGAVLDAKYLSPNKDQFRDNAGNHLSIESLPGNPQLNYNTWMSSNPLAQGNATPNVLVKYDANQQLLWKTYLPSENGSIHYAVNIKTDEFDNIYIYGETQKHGLGTAGTWMPDYYVVIDPVNNQEKRNMFMAKLNPQGQLQWFSYLPIRTTLPFALDIKNNMVVLGSLGDLKFTDSNLATPGSFSNIKADVAITSLNATTGQRNWGTYYGVPAGNNSGYLYEIKIVPEGILVLGNDQGTSYYATPGAIKSSSSIYGSNFVSLFSDDGSTRIWSTYLGDNGEETSLDNYYGYNDLMDYKNGKVLIVGSSRNGTNNISTEGAYQSAQANYYFTMIDVVKGTQNFTSYYGPLVTSFETPMPNGCKFLANENSFYITGVTKSANGITSTSATFPNILPVPYTLYGQPPTGFVAKFSYDPTMLATAEVSQNAWLVLYDNPNNGVFSIKGSALAKGICTVQVRDASGRLVLTQKLDKNPVAEIRLNTPSGNYVVTVLGQDGKIMKSWKMTVR